jgi:hypothetical protein
MKMEMKSWSGLVTCLMRSSRTAGPVMPTVASSWSTFKDGAFYLVVEMLSYVLTSRVMAARSSTKEPMPSHGPLAVKEVRHSH